MIRENITIMIIKKLTFFLFSLAIIMAQKPVKINGILDAEYFDLKSNL